MFKMVQHFMSVCIFCFLCATHSPCGSHADVTHDGPQYLDNRIRLKNHDEITPVFKEVDSSKYTGSQPLDNLVINSRLRKDTRSHSSNNLNTIQDTASLEDEYIKRLFKHYGDGDTLSLDAFQIIMKQFDLMQNYKASHEDSPHKHDHEEIKENSTSGCIIRENLYNSLKNESLPVNSLKLKQLCPTILYSIITGDCLVNNTSHDHNDDEVLITPSSLAWFYSIISVFLISACGLLGLAVIPIMNNRFYQSLLQFLVSLAVGTLAGDALLHLLPHAMSPHSSHGSKHKHLHNDDNIWKGFVAMLGLIFFFLMERIIMLAAKWRKKQQLKDKLPSKLKVIKPESSTQLTNAAEKQCKHKYSSFPYCYDEIKMDFEGPHEERTFHVPKNGETWESHNNTTSTGLDELGGVDEPDRSSVEKNQNMTECPNDSTNSNCSEINKMLSTEINKILSSSDKNKDDTDSAEYTVILREHESRHHGHSHTHGHVHAAPKNMSSVAWMVIMGDGLHNFTDGMAIGAAFASGVSGGFSTAVAVFCHELPHELGDFAMLLKAGMSMKQALFYNLLSSFLCLLGNLFGLWIGTTESASAWIFSAAAGMFLYIALVDMIPELTSGHESEGTLLQVFLHLSGLIMGFAIMALIALYEHDLKNIFED